MVKILQCSVLLLLAVMAVTAMQTRSGLARSNSTVRPTIHSTTKITRKTTGTKRTTKRLTVTTKRTTRASTPRYNYKTYYMNDANDCGSTNRLSTSDKVLVYAWQGARTSPFSSCKITFILNSADYHLEAGYSRSHTNFISNNGVTLRVYGGYNKNVIIYRDWRSLITNTGGHYQRIEVDLKNQNPSSYTEYDFSILITAQHDTSVTVWWLGILIPVIFIAIVASCIGCCVRRRRVLRYRRMNDSVTVTSATATYPTGTAAYPNPAPYPSGYQPPPSYPNQPSYEANQPIRTHPPAGYGATS